MFLYRMGFHLKGLSGSMGMCLPKGGVCLGEESASGN